MESFYGGRKGISFIISKRFDGIDIPEDTVYTGDYYATNVNGVFLIEGDSPIVRTAENQNHPDYIWQYHEHDGTKVQTGSNVKFKKEFAQGMVQFFAKGAETTSEVGYGEYVIIDTIGGLHNYGTIENGIVYRRGMDYQQLINKKDIKNPGAGAEYIGQVIGPQGETPIVDMDTVVNIEKDGNSNTQSYTTSNSGLVSGKTNHTIKYAWVKMLDEFGHNIGVKLGFTFPYTVFEFSAESISAYSTPTIKRTNNDTTPFYYKMKLGIPKGIHGTDAADFVLYEGEGGTRLGYTETDYSNSTPVSKFVDIGEWKNIEGVALSHDGTLTVSYTNGNPTPLSETIKWIDNSENTKGIELADDGTITVTYNTGEKNTFNDALTWITGASLTDKGVFKIIYNNNSKLSNYTKTLRWINKCTVADDGTVTFYYCTGEVAYTYDKYLKTIKDIKINTGTSEGAGNQKVTVTYNTGEVAEIGNPLNYVIESVVTDETTAVTNGAPPYHLLVLYADPNKRGNIKYPSSISGEVKTGWKDLGYVRGEAGGLRIIGNFDTISGLQASDGSWYEPSQVEGYTAERSGWGYTIEEKYFYLYDYNKKEWYNIGTISTNSSSIVLLDTSINDQPSETDQLYNNGLWFVVENSDSVE